ncbi:MAG TPA: chemotaxis-specific protein-glutamate methyltransferase CheB [Rhodospirillales bacterium]|nr:chemotaxis-specific protein-glutamate methyltransferase CheB [Rhodospirillales bacterium]
MPEHAHARAAEGPYRVLLTDDSGTVRRLVRRLLEREPDIRVVGEAEHGRSAVDLVRQAAASGQPVEIVLLDVEMPVMDGIAALERLSTVRPPPQVIMLSAHTRRGAVVTVKALARGASDYVCKPAARSDRNLDAFRQELLDKIRSCGAARRSRLEPAPSGEKEPRRTPPRPASREEAKAAPPAGSRRDPAAEALTRRPAPPAPPRPSTVPSRPQPAAVRSTATVAGRRPPSLGRSRVTALAIGSSTGGPQAVMRVLRDLGAQSVVPVFLTQHMPPAFTAAFAAQIAQELDLPCAEARQGEPVRAGRIYVAPGDFHLTVKGRPEDATIGLSKAPPEHFCRPAVDPMLRSLASVYGSGLVAVILTGMGSDGAEGCRTVVENGGQVIAQDRETSVVWGMPGAVVAAGLPATVLPLQRIGTRLRKLMDGVPA